MGGSYFRPYDFSYATYLCVSVRFIFTYLLSINYARIARLCILFNEDIEAMAEQI